MELPVREAGSQGASPVAVAARLVPVTAEILVVRAAVRRAVVGLRAAAQRVVRAAPVKYLVPVLVHRANQAAVAALLGAPL